MKNLLIFVAVVFFVFIGYRLAAFTVDQTQVAVVLEFGKVVAVVKEAGLHFKTPFVQSVVYLDHRLQSYEIKPAEIITADQRRLVVDNYTIWRIANPQAFVEKMSGLLVQAQSRIDQVVYSNVRNALADHTINDIISPKRLEYLEGVTRASQQQMQEYGLELIDVHVKRADLPQANEEAVYKRMASERQQIAAQVRAEGEQQATQIRAEADKNVTITLAEAQKQADQLKGEGDATSLKIFSDAYRQDPDFYRFWRTLQSYKETFNEKDTLVLSSESEYLQLLQGLQAAKQP